MADATAPRSRPQSPHSKKFSAEIPFRELKSISSSVLCSTHLHPDHHHHHQPKYRSVPLVKLDTQANQAASPAKSTSSSAPQSRSSTPLSTTSDSSSQRRNRKPSGLFKNFHFSVSSSRTQSSSYTSTRRDSLAPKSRRNKSASSSSSENGDIPTPPTSPKTTAMQRPAWVDVPKRRRRSRGYSAGSRTTSSSIVHVEETVDEMGFPFGKSVSAGGSRGRDLGSATHTVPRCPAHPPDPFSVHPGTPVDFGTPEVPSYPYKRHSASSKDDADEYHAYLSSEVRGKSLPEWGRA